MALPPPAPVFAAPATAPPLPRHVRRERLRLPTARGRRSTSPATAAPHTSVRVVRLPRPTPLAAWCAGDGDRRGDRRRLLRPRRTARRSASCARAASSAATSRSTRRGTTSAPACTSAGGTVRSRAATELPAEPARRPAAGRPAAGRAAARRASPATPRASRPARGQFDSDITDGRYPRAALGRRRARPPARRRLRRPRRRRRRADDGRARRGARRPRRDARRINLDGGGSTLARLRRARCATARARRTAIELAGGRPVSTALRVPATRRARDRAGHRRTTGYTDGCASSAP